MNKRLWQVYGIGLLLLVLLFMVVMPVYVQRIPIALESTGKKMLAQQGINWARVEAAGRDLLLSGNAPNPTAYQQALQTLQQVGGVRNVVDQMHPRLVSPYTMSIDWSDGKLDATGFLPDEVSYQEVGKLVAATYGGEATGQLQLAGGNPPGWTDMLLALFTNIRQLERAHVSITDQQLSVSGKTPHSATSEQLTQVLKAFERQGYQLDVNILAADNAAKVCQQKFNELLKQPIVFGSGDSKIGETSHPLLEQLSETAMLCPQAKITIAGHTDNLGSSESNLRLSQQRARAVAAWLIQEGIDSKRITATGHGSAKPVANNATEAGRAQNRRIEFIVQGK